MNSSQTRAAHLTRICILSFLLAFLAGCDNNNALNSLADESSKNARTEAAIMAMDEGDYQKARNILLKLTRKHPNDAKLHQYLASAYSGLAGLDTLNFLVIIDALDDSGNSGSIDMVGLVLGDGGGRVTAVGAAEKSGHIENAIEALNAIARNSDQTIQRGLLGVVHVALLLGEIIMDDLRAESIILTEQGISNLYGRQQADFSGVGEHILGQIDDSLDYIGEAVLALTSLSKKNDLSDDFVKFRNDIKSHEGPLRAPDLENYINGL